MNTLLIPAALLVLTGSALAQNAMQKPMTDDLYMAFIATAAPPPVYEHATIMRIGDDHEMKVVRQGDNGWSCMVANSVPMCADSNAMDWVHAWQSHGPSPERSGFIYMLNGDNGASNTDPWATGPASGNHWVKTGSHVMIVGPAAKSLDGYPREADADPTKPYVMWSGTPYEHLMLPIAVGTGAPGVGSSTPPAQ
jgi:hypothetical protein